MDGLMEGLLKLSSILHPSETIISTLNVPAGDFDFFSYR